MEQIAIGYIRRSKESGERTVSLEDQRRHVAAYALANGFALADVLEDDGVSGGRRSRFDRIRASVSEHGARAVIVANLDRFARDMAGAMNELDAFRRRGVELHVAGRGRVETETASGFIAAGVEALLGEHYRRLVSEKTRSALAMKRAKGERVGEVPFGFHVADDGRTLEPDDREQAILDLIRDLRATGATLQRIADDLNGRGIATRRGSAWRLQYIAALLKRAA